MFNFDFSITNLAALLCLLLPTIVVGICVYGVMKNKMIDATNKAYFKGRDEAYKDIPKTMEHLEKVREDFSTNHEKFYRETNYAYKAGVVDGVFSVLKEDGDLFVHEALEKSEEWHITKMDKEKNARYEKYLSDIDYNG